MLDTHKLIYILPEMAYVAEMLPGKKQHSFTVHNFRQINGNFIKNEKFVVENILKLFSKVDPDKYHIILPDSLFTNTIVSTTETGETKVKKYVIDTLLPSLEITTDTHYVETFILTEFKGVAKVQLSALEKELMAPLRAVAAQYDVKINGVSPLSWTVKSVVSLEPSITVLQIGSQIYTALQYIGVDQATISDVSDLDVVGETIKTLKGSEPSIQTVYLLTNEVVEKGLTEKLNSILPLQQLADFSEDDTKMPSYVKHIIESGMRTLEITDYPVPSFELGKATEEDMSSYVAGNLAAVEKSSKKDDNDDDTEEVSAALPTPAVVPPLPTPVAPPVLSPTVEPEIEALPGETTDDSDTEDDAAVETAIDTDDETEEIAQEEEPVTNKTDEIEEVEDIQDEPEELENDSTDNMYTATDNEDEDTDTNTDTDTALIIEPPVVAAATTQPMNVDKPLQSVKVEPKNSNDVDLSQFVQPSINNSVTPTSTVMPNESLSQTATQKPVIKNQSGIGGMVKMLLVTLVVFAITVAVGVGVGLGILTLTNKQTSDSSTIEVSPSPESIPTPSPSPSPEPEINKADFDILIVNATDKAGYAGTFKTKLDAAKYKSVKTGNAKGDYEEGSYVLMAEENPALVAALSGDTELDLTFQTEGYETEDATDAYDAVVVLAE